VTLYDTNEDILREQILQQFEGQLPANKINAWEDIDELLHFCSILKQDMITTFDSCLSLNPQRKDIIELYMNNGHPHMTEILATYWKLNGLEFSPFDTMTLVDWTYTYNLDLLKFGVKDGLIENGYLTLCNAYGKKIFAQLLPLLVGILKTEKDEEAVEEDGYGFLFTNAPFDLVKILSDSFQIVLSKRIKELCLRVLRVYQQILVGFQNALI
jgi:hypothetical protein